MPKYRRYKERHYGTAMLTDLRNLAVTEEAHWSEVGVYSADLSALKFSSTPEVPITVVTADSTGWSAVTTHANTSSKAPCSSARPHPSLRPPSGPSSPATERQARQRRRR